MTTPFDQQPQPVPPSEGTNDAPEDRANAPTVPNTVPAGQPNVASDGATTTPMAPATASQRPAGAPFDRVYAVSPQQLFQVIHDQLTTGATFTLDNENTQTGAFSFHSYDGVNCTLTVVPQGAAGAAIRLEATGNESAKRVDEFLAALDKRIGVAPAPATHGAGAATGFAGAAAPAVLAPNAQGGEEDFQAGCVRHYLGSVVRTRPICGCFWPILGRTAVRHGASGTALRLRRIRDSPEWQGARPSAGLGGSRYHRCGSGNRWRVCNS